MWPSWLHLKQLRFPPPPPRGAELELEDQALLLLFELPPQSSDLPLSAVAQGSLALALPLSLVPHTSSFERPQSSALPVARGARGVVGLLVELPEDHAFGAELAGALLDSSGIPQSSAAGVKFEPLLLWLPGVFRPLGFVEPQEFDLDPQSSPERELPGLELVDELFALVLVAQALVAAFQSSGSVPAGAADRDVLLGSFPGVPQASEALRPQSAAVSGAVGLLDGPEGRLNGEE